MTNERSRLRFVAPLRLKTPLRALTGDIAFLPMESIADDGTYDRSSVRPAVEVADSGYTYFEQGDVVRARVTPCFENGKGALLSTLPGGRGLGTTELFVFKPSRHIDARFLYYVTASADFTRQGAATLYGAHGVRRVDDNFARDYRIWVPSIPTQRVIADYLDRETARIDALIAAKRRMLTLLGEHRQALREAMVTEAWAAGPGVRLGHVLREVDDRLGAADPPPLLSVSIHRGVIPFSEANPDRIPRADDLANCKRCEPDDVVLNRMRAFQGGIGRARLAGIVSPDYAVLRPSARAFAGYLNHLLRSPWFVGNMEARLRGIGGVEQGNVRTPRVNWDDLRTIRVPAPPRRRQIELAEQLSVALQRSSNLQNAIERQLVVIQEHRQTLITAVVTGELDIPEAA